MVKSVMNRVSRILAQRLKGAMTGVNDTELANLEMDRYFQDNGNRDRFSRRPIEPDVGDPHFDQYHADDDSIS